MDETQQRMYYNVLTDVWKFLKARLLSPDNPLWDNDNWWDCVMSEAGTVSGRYKDTECHDFAIRMMNTALNELQRLAKRGND